MRKIIFYKTISGRSPIEEFLDSLSPKQAQKAAWVLKLVEDLEVVPLQYFKKMKGTEELWEVRVIAGPDSFRFLGFFDDPNLVILNHAFRKKTQKISRNAIAVAEKRRRDYFARRERK